jgi:hypothetical protein
MRDGFEVEGKFRGRRENILFVQTVQWGGEYWKWDGMEVSGQKTNKKGGFRLSSLSH